MSLAARICMSLLFASSAASAGSAVPPATETPVSAPAPVPPAAPQIPQSVPADVVAVEGVVLATSSRWVGKSQLIVTDVTLSIEQTSDPKLHGTLVFKAPGGELIEQNLRMQVNAVPIFRVGQKLTVSLSRKHTDGNLRYIYRTHLRGKATSS